MDSQQASAQQPSSQHEQEQSSQVHVPQQQQQPGSQHEQSQLAQQQAALDEGADTRPITPMANEASMVNMVSPFGRLIRPRLGLIERLQEHKC